MGFRKGKSCIDNLSILTTDIQKNFYQKDSVSAFFLDGKGAYDDVNPEILIDDLIKLGIPRKTVSFISFLIFERKVLFSTLAEIIEKIINKGLPQGSILSPILYAIYTRNLYKQANILVDIIQYADDVCIYYKENNTNVKDQIFNLEKESYKVVKFLFDRGLDIAPEKSVLIIFDNKSKNVLKDVSININNNIVKASEHVKFLDMCLDRRLNWQMHINYIRNKSMSSMRILSCLRKTWWSADPSSLLITPVYIFD